MVKDCHFQIICIKTDSGLPLFVRSVGSPAEPSDTVVTSLNGIYTFCSSYGVKLIQTTAGDVCISWKTFYKSLTLILVTDAASNEKFHENLLNLIFNSFIFLLGFDKVQQNASFDELKKNLQICYHLVDTLVTMSNHPSVSCGMTQTISCLASPDLHKFQVQFEGYANSIGTLHGCFFVAGLLSASTAKLFQLSPHDLVLLQSFVGSVASNSPSIVETAIFLPESRASRVWLVLLRVLHDGVICLLFDEIPRLPEIISMTQVYWSRSENQINLNTSRGNLELALDFSRMLNKSLPVMKDINKDIISFLLINRSKHRSLICTDVNRHDINTKIEKGRILKAFYEVAQRFFPYSSSIENIGQDISVPCTEIAKHVALATYVCLEAFKCYAFHDEERELYIVFDGSIPSFALRSVSKEFLQHLLGLKWFHLLERTAILKLIQKMGFEASFEQRSNDRLSNKNVVTVLKLDEFFSA